MLRNPWIASFVAGVLCTLGVAMYAGPEALIQAGVRYGAFREGLRQARLDYDFVATPREAVAMTADARPRRPRQEPSPEPARRRR